MYHNVPEKMKRNKFVHASCPNKRKLYAQCANLTLPNYPTGQTAIVDVDPVEALNRISQEDYEAYEASLKNQPEK